MKEHILQRSESLVKAIREQNKWIDREIGEMKNVFPEEKNKEAKAIEEKDIVYIDRPIERDMKNARVVGEKIHIQPLTLR